MFDEAIKLALRTWYPSNHKLHYDPHHPLMKLTGEWGELLDDYAKSIYKPDYKFNSTDKLGDIWYYLRILCYQNKCDRHGFAYHPTIYHMRTDDIGFIIATAIFHSSEALCSYFRGSSGSIFYLDICYSAICLILERRGITLEELTESNWEKLKPGSNG